MTALFSLPLGVIALVVAGVVATLALHVPAPALLDVLTSAEIAFAVGMSLQVSLAAVALATVLGVPTAWLLARRRVPLRWLVETLLDLPLVMPPLVAGVGLLFLLGRQGIGGTLAMLGLEVLFSPAGAVIAQTYVATAVIVRGGRAAFAAVDRGYAEAAALLGRRPLGVFIGIELPLAARGLAAAAVMGWGRAIGEFGATLMVAGAVRHGTETLPMAVYLNIASGETDLAVAAALILLAVSAALLLGLRAIGRLAG